MPRKYTFHPGRKAIRVIGPSIAYIPLTQGQFALVDVEDADELERFKWYAYWDKTCQFYYAKRRMPGPEPRQVMSMHAYLLGLYKSHLTADHKYLGNGLDNRRANLRPANAYQQARNQRLLKTNTSGLKGAYWHKQHGYWTSSIHLDGKLKHLGIFETPEAAHAAYCAKAKELHGEFARTA